jgi:hypothetical protein
LYYSFHPTTTPANPAAPSSMIRTEHDGLQRHVELPSRAVYTRALQKQTDLVGKKKIFLTSRRSIITPDHITMLVIGRGVLFSAIISTSDNSNS